MIESTPAWVDVVNAVFITLCVEATVCWIWRLFRSTHHRIHSFCHIAMAAGMGWMLMLMLMNGWPVEPTERLLGEYQG